MSTLTIQPDDTHGYDAELNQQFPTSNFSTGETIDIGLTVVGNKFFPGDKTVNGIWRFDLSAIASGSTVNSATLTLTGAGGELSNAFQFNISRVTQTGWTLNGVTWNSYDGTNAWSSGGGDVAFDSQITISAAGDNLVFDAKNLVIDAMNNRGRRLDVIVNCAGADGSVNYTTVCSSHNSTAAPRPKLVIDYAAPTGRLLVHRGMSGGMQNLTGNLGA